MSIVKCTAYPFRYAAEAYAEPADEAEAIELFDASLYTGMFSIDFETRRAGRPCLDGVGRKRNLAQRIGKDVAGSPGLLQENRRLRGGRLERGRRELRL